MSRRARWGLVAVLLIATSLCAAAAGRSDARNAGGARDGGVLRVSLAQFDFDYIDPALSLSVPVSALLDTTCARLLAYPDKAPPAAFKLQPEVAAAMPTVSADSKTWTFTLRPGFRFSDGKPVHADAFARAINRTLAPGVTSPAAQYTKDIVGAGDVRAGKTASAAGIVARGNTLVVRFTRPMPDFAVRTTMSFFCAVPPTLPAYPEGAGAFPSAGPYYVAAYRPGEHISIQRNRYYGGTRPHHVDGFEVDLTTPTEQEVLDQVERGDADWGYALGPVALESGRNLIAKYGINKSQFFIKPGYTLRLVMLNSSRPLFKNNPKLRRAINMAVNRRAVVSAVSPVVTDRLTDQYLPPDLPGFRNADIYPLNRANLAAAKKLAAGNMRGGKAVFYVPNFPPPLAAAQAVKQQLEQLGLEIEIKPIPFHITSSGYLGKLGFKDEPWDMALTLWTDVVDPYGYINTLFDDRYIGSTNLARFSSSKFDVLMRRASQLEGDARYRTYGQLDVQLSRDAAPIVPIGFLSESTLVSPRIGCIVLRPVLDLTAACLK